MKYLKLFSATLVGVGLTLSGSVYAQEGYGQQDHDRILQLGAVMISPYRLTDPDGRLATLFGARGEVFLSDTLSLGVEGIFGVEDKGFNKHPLYITPGITVYPAQGAVLEPFLRFDTPILLNTDSNDLGLRAGVGLMFNIFPSGLALKYSFDAAYYVDQDTTVLNLANIGVVYNF